MIELDEQQDRLLRDEAAEIGREAERLQLKWLRFEARVGLSLWRWWNPQIFDEWNRRRIEEYRINTGWYRR